MAKLYTTIYPFMWQDLKLEGFTKEVFAVLFGFCVRSAGPVPVPYRNIRNITGASQPTVAKSIRRLEEAGIVKAVHVQGKCTMYRVTLPGTVLRKYEEQSGLELTYKDTEQVKTVNRNRLIGLTATSKETEPHNRSNRYKEEKKEVPIDSIRVPASSSYEIPSGIKTLTTL